MKKVFLLTAMTLLGLGHGAAQSADDLGIFNHVGLGLGVGTTGVSIEAAAPITPYVAVRAGANIMPGVKYGDKLDTSFSLDPQAQAIVNAAGYSIPQEVDVEGKLTFSTGHVLFDLFPAKGSSFHLTVGAYFGGDKIVKVYNKEDGALSVVNAANQQLIQAGLANQTTHENMIGLSLDEYFLTPDSRGNVEANIKVASFRPYVGLGFGRPVPTKHRFACNFDMGVQFWGSPKVYLQDKQLTSENTNGEDGGLIKVLSKVSVWPVLNLRLVGRIF